MNKTKLQQILQSHAAWVRGDLGGVKANLSGLSLRGMDLRGVNLSKADLSGADFYKANLQGADLSYTALNNAYLSYANLQKANLIGADVRGANLVKTKLKQAILDKCYLTIDGNWIRLNGANFQQIEPMDLSKLQAKLAKIIICRE